MAEGREAHREEGPRIHVDEDWKERARREKEEHERLSRERQQQSQGRSHSVFGLLRPSFAVVAELLAAQATAALAEKRLDVARFWVDTLGVLETKTRGNLDADERRLLDSLLFQLRMACVELARELAAGGTGQTGQGVSERRGSEASS